MLISIAVFLADGFSYRVCATQFVHLFNWLLLHLLVFPSSNHLFD